MKAIETQYKGYRFRSRLEARWAIFFDELGIRWQYETEGFVLNDKTWYLPDFFINIKTMMFNQSCFEYWDIGHFDIFIEIKPTPETAADAGNELYNNFNEPIAIIPGTPYYYPINVMFSIQDDGKRQSYMAHIGVDDNDEPCLFCMFEPPGEDASYGIMHMIIPMMHRTQHASEAARSARFEFGESGAG